MNTIVNRIELDQIMYQINTDDKEMGAQTPQEQILLDDLYMNPLQSLDNMSQAISGRQANKRLFCENINEQNAFIKNFEKEYKRLVQQNNDYYH